MALEGAHAAANLAGTSKLSADAKENIRTTRCSHMGCQLSWNPEEGTYDCPCHGSRFDARGNLLDGPAQKGSVKEAIDGDKILSWKEEKISVF